MRRTISLPLLLLMLSTPGQAAIYKWVDEKGVTHYTEQPPAHGKGQEIQPRTTPPATPAPAPAAQSTAQPPATPAQSTPREVMTLPAEKLNEQCQNARQRLQQLEASPRILIKGPDGEMQRVPEEERQRMIDEERKRVQLYCE